MFYTSYGPVSELLSLATTPDPTSPSQWTRYGAVFPFLEGSKNGALLIRDEPPHYLLWGGWLVVSGAVLSAMSGTYHDYYTVALAPAVAALVAALLAAVSLLPKAKTYAPVVAVAAVLGVLLVIGQIVNRPSGFSVGWALWLVLVFTVLQASAAVTALLFDHGVLTPPAPRPNYGPYGPPPGGFYGHPGARQVPGYPTPYGSYGQSGGGYGAPDSSPPTPPTGFPAVNPSSSVSPSSVPDPTSSHGPTAGSAGPTQP